MRFFRILGALAVTVVLVVAGSGAASARDTRPARPFLVFDTDSQQIWVSDLSGARRPLVRGSDPSVAVRGSRVWFQGTSGRLTSIGLNGRNRIDLRITGYSPVVSPGGGLIAYGRAGDLFVAFSGGQAAHRVAVRSWHPVFSRDGRSILFQAANGISRVAVTGGPVTRIQRGRWFEVPIGESASGRIVFVSNRGNTSGSELYSMNAQGGDVRRLVNVSVQDGDVSPDGRSVVYAELVGGYYGTAPSRLRIVDIRTGAVRALTTTGQSPEWGLVSR